MTFVFTDVEGSTRLWEAAPDSASIAMTRHDRLIEDRVTLNDGVLVRPRGEGDSRFAVFSRATDALQAALEIQRALAAEPWPTPEPIRVRIALHTGEADLRDGDYYGTSVNRCARIRAAGHGGQVLLSSATQELVRDKLPEGASLRNLGEHRLRDLIRPERVFQLLHSELPADFPTLRTLDVYPNNLPLQMTSFVGREREIAEVKRLLTVSRLVTLTGIGGCGKTRLSLEIAADLIDSFPDGVFLAELAPIGEQDLVPRTVAAALSVHEDVRRSAEESLVRHLREKRLLLLLDNCEHLIEACARLAESLLQACPSLQILATSREALGIPGELAFRVPSLSLPDARRVPPPNQLSQFESVRLFLDRARAINPLFHVSSANAPAIAQISWRLDGIPLAIELAAAKTRLLTPEQIARRLDDQFRLLAGGSRTAVPRQQTLRAAIDWSYSLLSPNEQTLFRRLAVFSSGFSLDAAEVVGSDLPLDPFQILDLLSSLVDKSLVLVDQPDQRSDDRTDERSGETPADSNKANKATKESTESGAPQPPEAQTASSETSTEFSTETSAEARYHLLETIRQYARDRLLEANEAKPTRDHHLSFFLNLAEGAKPELEGAQQGAWLDVLEVEVGNLRSALEWSLETAPDLGLRLAASLVRFWQVRGRVAEAYQWLVETLSRAPARTQMRAEALLGVAILGSAVGATTPEEALLEEGLAIYREIGDRRGIAWALENLGAIIASRGDFPRSHAVLEESLAICREIGDLRRSGWALRALGATAVAEADYTRAEAYYLESLALFQSTGEKWGAALGHSALANFSQSRGQHDLARARFESSLRLFRETGSRGNQAATLIHLGNLSCSTGDFRRARVEIGSGHAIFADIDAPELVAWAVACLGDVAASEGAREEARSHLTEAMRLLNAVGVGDASIVAVTQAIAAALSGRLGDLAGAASLARRCLSFFRRVHYYPGVAHCLGLLGALAVERGAPSDGVRQLAAASGLDPSLGSAMVRDLGEEREQALAKARASLGEEAYSRAWAAGLGMSLDEAVAEALSETSDD